MLAFDDYGIPVMTYAPVLGETLQCQISTQTLRSLFSTSGPKPPHLLAWSTEYDLIAVGSNDHTVRMCSG